MALFAFSVAPMTGGDSVSAAVAEAVRIVRESGLPNRTTSMFTEIEGEWDEVMPVIKAATDAVAAGGHRTSLVVKADIRPGAAPGQIDSKIARVEERLTTGDESLGHS
ncbi:thiamine-binding protein [Myceligenerans indicum]|uniref:Thiamine-binding protein n=1 Tax=Myceligenerans indicum TaxID=2593663 RepID=A0ABS1LPB6_9MICO|nr:thiamine-binding protein [Myceligenerans indicum]MBL0888127.1 thiamine-binding protein [Myceligenerans indicum]